MAAHIPEFVGPTGKQATEQPVLDRALSQRVPALDRRFGLAALAGELLVRGLQPCVRLAKGDLLTTFRGQQLAVALIMGPLFVFEA